MACGASRITPVAVSRACSISIITAIRSSSRSGRWRATAISRPEIPVAWRWGCDRTGRVTILAVTGLKREAEIAGGDGVVAVAGGGDAKTLAEKLDALHGDIKGVISFGLGGGLSPLLKVGDVVIGESVQVAVACSRAGEGRRGETIRCHERWRVALAAKLPGAHQGPVA